ncbi:Clavaminate synthase-like protein At3g21360 [Linum perenne]
MANFFKEISVPNQKRYNNSPPFPAVMTPAFPSASLADFISVIESQKPYIESLLQKTGAILFRGFPVSTASQFNQVVEAFDYADQPYVGGSATRTHVIGRVFTSNESPPHQKIPFHHEMAYASEFPTKLFFFCEVEPGSGGETPIVLSYRIYERMKEKYPDFVTKLEKEGLIFNRVMTGEDDPSSAVGRGWKSTFSTDDRVVAQERFDHSTLLFDLFHMNNIYDSGKLNSSLACENVVTKLNYNLDQSHKKLVFRQREKLLL